ncbi:MAG: HEAT repeat domain-containing protein [Treponema sp.]|nr:HEAT repeat domain-containing protein [Treponema sp.]
MTVEESYLQESIENMIIREQSRADSRDIKIAALVNIGSAMERGNKSEEIRQALEYMGLEGTVYRILNNGRLINNFPDVRRECAKYLGILGTAAAKDVLLKIAANDNEPLVIQEAIKSLGDIGIDDNGRTINTIGRIVQKFQNINPDNLLAFSAIVTIEKLGLQFGLNNQEIIQILLQIHEGPYLNVVKNRARLAMDKIQNARKEQQRR